MRLGVKYGLLLAASVSLWTLIVHVLGIYTTRIRYAHVVDQAALVLPIVVVTLALLAARRRRDGQLSWRLGILTGLEVAAVASPLTVAALWIYHHAVNPEWLSILVNYERERLGAAGASPDAIALAVSRLQQGGTDRAQIVSGLLGTLAMVFALSVVITLLLKLVGSFRNVSAARTV